MSPIHLAVIAYYLALHYLAAYLVEQTDERIAEIRNHFECSRAKWRVVRVDTKSVFFC